MKVKKELTASHRVNSAYMLGLNTGKAEELKRVGEVIDKHQNPYPKDIFLWNNKEELGFNRGRFNQWCFEIVEIMREELKEELGIEKTQTKEVGK